MVKNIHEEVIDVFHNKFYITAIEKVSSHIFHVRIVGSMECVKNSNDSFIKIYGKNNLKLKKYYAEKLNEKTGTEIQSQHLVENRQLSIE